MRVLIITPIPPSAGAPGAIPIVVHAQVQGLSRRHEVVVATVAGPDPAELQAVERLRRSGIEVHYATRSVFHGLAKWRRRMRLGMSWARGRYPWRTVWFAEPALQSMLDRLLLARHFDIVAVEDNSMAVYRFATSAARVLTEHEVRKPRSLDLQWQPVRHLPRAALRELDWARWSRYQPAMWRKFDMIHVFTRRDADALEAQAPDLVTRVRVTPFGIVLPPLPSAGREESYSTLFVGNFTHPPNVDAAFYLLSEVLPHLQRRVPEVRLRIVGPYAPPSLVAVASERVEVVGEVAEIEPYFDRAAVVLAPVRIGGGMRMKVVQAMALAKAVVTTARGAEGLRVAGENVPLAIADGAERTAEITAQLLTSADVRHELGQRARDYVSRHFSETSYADRLEKAYADAVLSERR